MSTAAALQTLAAKAQPLNNSAHAGLLLQRKCACGSPTSSLTGECAECKSKKRLQTKLTIGASNDPQEQEADRVADQVLAVPANTAVRGAAPHIQRFSGPAGGQADTAPPSVDSVLASSGRPLEPALRQDMEQRFGHDFSRVRVHTDEKAAESARAVDALAFTVGRDIVFGADKYARSTGRGLKLLAHELTHTIQQGIADPLPSHKLEMTNSTDPSEREADSVTHTIASGKKKLAFGAASRSRLQRAPADGGNLPNRHASTLPYRESKELLKCILILGEKSADYCRQQVLGEKPPLTPSEILAQELQALIDVAEWEEIRKRVYPKESAAGVQRAKDRKTGKLPDLKGLGRITTLEHLAMAVRGIQAKWSTLLLPDRVKELGKAANTELKAADVPEFLIVDKEPMKFKGFFNPHEWKFVISEALVNDNSFNDDAAAEVTNTTLHEARHAEQQFLAARFSAGVNKKDAAAIVTEQHIPKVIADQAVTKQFDAATDPATVDMGKKMFKAQVTNRAKNQAISNDDGLADLATKRGECQTALNDLKASATAQTIADATAKRDALRAQITVVEQKYTLYRDIPYEADAHEVGDAAAQAFQGWPP